MTEQQGRAEAVAAVDIASNWIAGFAAAVTAADASALEELFAPGASWRDFLSLTWDLRNFREPAGIASALLEYAKEMEPRDWQVRYSTPPSLVEQPSGSIVSAMWQFETNVGSSGGAMLLEPNPDTQQWQATAIFTMLEGLHAHPAPVGVNRPLGKRPGVEVGRVPWAEMRAKEVEFLDHEPQVVIMGAGQGGLMLAARLGVLGVKTLILEKNSRVGDNWRERYGSLALHDAIKRDHFPFIPLPPTWPNYSPKDKLADFFEAYATLMDLNVWTGSTILSTSHDADAERWTVEVRRADGSLRTLRPRHFVSAVGLNGLPRVPEFRGAESFKGRIVHSGRFDGGRNWVGKNVLVVGGGTSGHDVVQDCYEQGANVSMLLRSSGNTMQIASYQNIFSPAYLPEGPHHEDADILTAVLPYDRQLVMSHELQKVLNERDRDLREGLERAGFRVDSGVNGDGVASGLKSGRMSYYFNIGAADLIVEGKVKVHRSTIDRLTENGVVLADGTELPVDLLVCATGYGPTLEAATPVIGQEMAAKVKVVYELGMDGEMLNVWRRTPQPGLWFMIGSLQQSRLHSIPLALLIKAVEEGLIPYDGQVPTPDQVLTYESAQTRGTDDNDDSHVGPLVNGLGSV